MTLTSPIVFFVKNGLSGKRLICNLYVVLADHAKWLWLVGIMPIARNRARLTTRGRQPSSSFFAFSSSRFAIVFGSVDHAVQTRLYSTILYLGLLRYCSNVSPKCSLTQSLL